MGFFLGETNFLHGGFYMRRDSFWVEIFFFGKASSFENYIARTINR
jgi:hypothetical protein